MEAAVEFQRVKRYTSGRSFNVYSKHELTDRLTTGALCCAFRVKRSDHGDDWACYDWGSYQNVPVEWRQTKNHLINKADNIFIDYMSNGWRSRFVEHAAYIDKAVARTLNITPSD